MAIEEHENILKKGVEVWNKWRRENPDIKPDLHEANLHQEDLSGANLSDANLIKANLSEADLNGANLRKAILNGANLSKAKLSRADFKKESLSRQSPIFSSMRDENLDVADLSDAGLSEANLRGSDLRMAKLRRAHLFKADLSEADLSDAGLSEANLRWSNVRRANLKRAHLFKADLSEADLSDADLEKANLREVEFSGANLNGANLSLANLEETNLYRAKLLSTNFEYAELIRTNFCKADLSGAILRYAKLKGANLHGAILNNAKINGADLDRAVLVETKLKGADLSGCRIYGISAWNLEIDESTTKQANLIISLENEPEITVDNLEIAQFIYLLLNNEKIRDVIDTITSKVVLILGRFSEDRKPILDLLRSVLRDLGLAPVLFDFDKPSNKDITGTVETLARMARFIIADLTDPSSIPHELATIVPFMRTTPVIPIRLKGSEGYSMFDDLEAAYNWVLPKYEYENVQILIESVSDKIIEPAETMVKKLRGT